MFPRLSSGIRISFALLIIEMVVVASVTGCLRDPTKPATPSELWRDQKVVSAMNAVNEGRLDDFKSQVAKGIDLDSRGLSGMTPLGWVMGTNRKEAFRILLENGADPNAAMDSGDQLLVYASKKSDSEYVEMLLKRGADPNAPGSKARQTPIFRAITSGEIENVKLLLNHGANIDHSDEFGSTPLIAAAFEAEFDIALLLLVKGANQSGSNIAENGFLDGLNAHELESAEKISARQRVLDWLKEQERNRERSSY